MMTGLVSALQPQATPDGVCLETTYRLDGSSKHKPQNRKNMKKPNLIRFPVELGHRSLLALALVAVIAAGCQTKANKTENAVSSNVSATDNKLPSVLDLKPFYNKVFVGPDGTNSSYAGYFGRKTIDGLPFDVDGEIYLYGKSPADRGDVRRDEVTGIKIARKFDELHLIHAVQWREYYGCPVVILRLHYADGTSHDFTLRYNFQVIDWARLLSEEQEIITDPDTKIIWRGPGVYKGTGRLFESVLHNPYPAKWVDSLYLISTHSRASYTLVAATVARSDPRREVTAPMLLEPSLHFDGVLKVHVVDKETGAAIVGADVSPGMTVDDEGVVADPILTSTDGVAVVKYPVSRTSDVEVEVSKQGYSGRNGNWQGGGIPGEITYRLTASRASIQGVVLDDQGQPLAGAQVRFNAYTFGDVRRSELSAQSNYRDGCHRPLAHPGFAGRLSGFRGDGDASRFSAGAIFRGRSGSARHERQPHPHHRFLQWQGCAEIEPGLCPDRYGA